MSQIYYARSGEGKARGQKAGWNWKSRAFELNEAFSVQALRNEGIGINPDFVNVNGGAVAMGHHRDSGDEFDNLLYEMKRRGAKRGVAGFV